LTPVYIFRAVFIVFFGPAHAEISGSYGVRVVLPLVVLGAGAVGIGWLETPKILGGAHWLSDMLAPATGRGVYGLAPVVLLAGLLAPLAGVGAAYALYRRGVWAAPAQGRLAGFVWAGCGLERLAVAFHRRLRATQTGQIRRYAGWLMAGSAATLALWFLA
jgi:NADH-quinone oxidoreductase subunit L